MTPSRSWMGFAALLFSLGIVAGAFGAHALRDSLPADKLEVFRTGVHYHQIGSLSLFAMAALAPNRWALRLLAAGTLAFAFTLYGYTTLGIKWLAMITPVGGAMMIIAWAICGFTYLKTPER